MEPTEINFNRVDLGVVIVSNLANLLMVGIFLSRSAAMLELESFLGLCLIALALPLSSAIFLNIVGKRPWWTAVLPSFLASFCVLELLLDYVLKLNFRDSAWLGPYLLIYYLGLMGMIGYAFLVKKNYGFITLASYFINLLATWYSYSNIGHG